MGKHEYCEYKEKIDDYEDDVEEEKRKISSAGSSAERKAIRKNIRGYNKDIKKMMKLLPLYENAILNCARGKQDFDCNVYDYGRMMKRMAETLISLAMQEIVKLLKKD